MEEQLIAPCGMNCAVCSNYLAMKNDLKQYGIKKTYCAGCLPRGKNCTFMKKSCDLLGNGLVRFCLECRDFPCKRLKALDKRYRTSYRLSMIENLEKIKANGMEEFLDTETDKWRCPACGGNICCHNGLCYHCDLDRMRPRKQNREEH